MNNNERKIARRYDAPNRNSDFTSKVYSGLCDDKEKLKKMTFDTEKRFYPPKSKYNIYFGELHGHSNLSDGRPSPDEYFANIRDNAGLDFAALTDHDHGGIGNAELYGEKWEYIKRKAEQYNDPGRFTVILGYERDSYPWYNNMSVYYNNYEGDMIYTDNRGEISEAQLNEALKRDDVLIVPHDTYSLEAGVDLENMPLKLLAPLIEVYSRGDCAEYFSNPWNSKDLQCSGGFWQDALKRGARMGCIAASDDHNMQNGIISDLYVGISRYPGITAVLAESNTLSSIFEALKARRCYGFMGGRMWIDFRINEHCMGEEFISDDDRSIYIKVEADCDLKQITLVKNCRNYIIIKRNEQLIFDYKAEKPTDVYYLRVELCDGRCGWTSPIWINSVNRSEQIREEDM